MYAETLRSVAVVALGISLSAQTLSPASAAPVQEVAPTAVIAEAEADLAPRATTIISDSEELVTAAQRAIDMFAELGLELPPIDLRVYSTTAPCRRPDGSDRVGVTIMKESGYTVLSCGSYFTLLHELAHVWDHSSLDDDLRQKVLDLRGLDTWSHRVWNQAGGAHLASIIAWGLIGVRPTLISPNSEVSLAEAFQLATGSEVPTLTRRGLEVVDGHMHKAVASNANNSGSASGGGVEYSTPIVEAPS